MICPRCLKEYEDYDNCPLCQIKLMTEEELSGESMDLVTVFKTNDPGLIPIIKSLLSDAEIPYKTNGDGLQAIYSFGKTIFQVLKQDEAIAKQILEELEEYNMEIEK